VSLALTAGGMIDQQGGPGNDSTGALADCNERPEDVRIGLVGCIHTSLGPKMAGWVLAALCDLVPYATTGLQVGQRPRAQGEEWITGRIKRMPEMDSASRTDVEPTCWEGLAQSGCVEDRKRDGG
jgi:hypothetical protein